MRELLRCGAAVATSALLFAGAASLAGAMTVGGTPTTSTAIVGAAPGPQVEPVRFLPDWQNHGTGGARKYIGGRGYAWRWCWHCRRWW
ncbi:MAG: hypothetical protein JO366_10455 [Methylobacteriaceae bacterium]|nr:hypothetical protein [Methylobacteriaceae bacterium]MBV9245218.1 hypothetical protein [Methylobacteriaceae bacterium]MBV9635545.1 hypothetical protein [Methylobacteriaceae bacterium]MBV9702243.1 hypothetical protein [Methylobacteriaceae bacterium]